MSITINTKHNIGDKLKGGRIITISVEITIGTDGNENTEILYEVAKPSCESCNRQNKSYISEEDV